MKHEKMRMKEGKEKQSARKKSEKKFLPDIFW